MLNTALKRTPSQWLLVRVVQGTREGMKGRDTFTTAAACDLVNGAEKERGEEMSGIEGCEGKGFIQYATCLKDLERSILLSSDFSLVIPPFRMTKYRCVGKLKRFLSQP